METTFGPCEAALAKMSDFNEFFSLIGFEEVWEFDKKWAQVP